MDAFEPISPVPWPTPTDRLWQVDKITAGIQENKYFVTFSGWVSDIP